MNRWRLCLAVVGAVAFCAGIAVLDHYHVGVFHDDAMYVILAKSLATGHGFRFLNLPNAPVASHFPPAYPLALSLLWRIAPNFPVNLVLFKLLNVVLFTACAVLVTKLVRERFDSMSLGLAVGLASAVSVPLLVLVTMVMSETMFLAGLLTVLLFGERFLESSSSARMALPLGLAIGALVLTRAHGVVLIPAICIPLAQRKRWKEAGTVCIGACILLAPWQTWTLTHGTPLPLPLAGNYGSYTAWWSRGLQSMGFSMIPATMHRTASDAASMLMLQLTPVRQGIAQSLTLILTGLTVAVGGATLARRAPATAWFLAGYMAIVFIWPFPPSRFIWGIWPLMLMLVAAAASLARRSSGSSMNVRAGLAVAIGWLTIGYCEYEVRAVRGAWWGSISRTADLRIDAAIEAARATTSPHEVLAADDEGAIYLYTGRSTVPVASFTTAHYLSSRSPDVEANEGLVPLIKLYPVRVVIVGSKPTYDAASYLTRGATPLLSAAGEFSQGAVFTVLNR